MKIITHEEREMPRDETVSDYIFRSIHEGNVWGGMETMERITANNTVAVGRLIELLAKKGMLTAPEVTSLVKYEIKNAKFYD